MLERPDIVARLLEIADLMELRGTNKFKARAFEKGARAIEALREPIGTLVAERRLTDIPGIGAALAKTIEELYTTERSELLESLREGIPAGFVALSRAAGLALPALFALDAEIGVKSVDDLRRAAEDGRVRTVKGFDEKKETKILESLARHEAKAGTILLHEGLRLAAAIEAELRESGAVKSVHLAGSLGRSQEVSTELAFVAVGDDPRAVVDAACGLERVAGVASVASVADIASGNPDCSLRLADGTRVDVAVATPETLPATLARATSAPAHWDALVLRARDAGFTLSRSGLAKRGAPVPLADERALYAALGLAWVPPELREGQGEIEAAARGESWDDLVTEADVRGFVHCHTTWSDGKATVLDMARAAEARGASFITITDHSAAAFYAQGLDVERLARQSDEIDAAQEKVTIKILKGTEADILSDGALDWPDAVLDRLDVVIASIHARHRQDEAKMTERVLRAMRHPVFKIWGHPLGRLVTSRPPIPLRVEEVLDALAASRGAVEINGDPHRLDLEPRWVRAARERGLAFTLSVDAHSVPELGNVRYAVGLARRAGVRRGDVLNARSPDAFAKAVAPAAS